MGMIDHGNTLSNSFFEKSYKNLICWFFAPPSSNAGLRRCFCFIFEARATQKSPQQGEKAATLRGLGGE
jgi:hypothetical protein